MTSRTAAAERREHEYLSPATRIRFLPVVADSAEGVHFTDVEGHRYLDFHSMASVANVGYSHPAVNAAIRQQAERLSCCNIAYALHEPALELAERLTRIAPPHPAGRRVAFGLSGSDANDGALKLARAATGRWRAIAFTGAYHGTTYGALGLSATDLNMSRGFGPAVPGISHMPFPDTFRMDGGADHVSDACLEHLRVLLATSVPPEEVAAVFIEPIQGDSGVIVPPPGFLAGLSRICEEHGMLLVVDEVQTGMGRTGRWLAVDHEETSPDIVLLGKALGSGLPISAVVARSDLMDSWNAPGHVFGVGGNPLSCAAALATLDVIEGEGLLENAALRGEQLRTGLLDLRRRYEQIGDVRGRGLLLGVDLVASRRTQERAPELAKAVLVGCLKRGLYLTYLAGNVLRLVPPLVISQDEVAWAIDVLDTSIGDAVNGRVDPAETAAIVGW